MSTVRLRRLTADSQKLQDYVRRHPRVRLVQMDGDPPDRYHLEYSINSLRMVGGELQPMRIHLVEITLPLQYPRLPPQCRMLSPVFHPNIAPHAICVGDHWSAGESLESIIVRIGEMLAYQSYNVKSPLNGEAARWVEENKHRVPLDPVSLLPEEDTQAATQPSPQTPPSTARAPAPKADVASKKVATPAQQHRVKCPSCGSVYQVGSSVLGKMVRCKCGQAFKCAQDDSTRTSEIG